MDRSAEENLRAKRPRRCVQSKLSFSAASQASELVRSASSSPTSAAADGESTTGAGDNESERKRNDSKKRRGGHPKENADINEEAQKMCNYNKKGNRGLETTRPGVKTPRKRTSPMKRVELNSKRSLLNGKSDNFEECDEGNLNIFSDLWSEAKKDAEENLRLSAGKQTHPFFSICRTMKKPSYTKGIEKQDNICWFAFDGDYSVSLPPVHIFDIVKDVDVVPDWKNWKFIAERPPEFGGNCSMDYSSVFEGSIKSLSFEGACAMEKGLYHLFDNEKMNSENGVPCSSKPFYESASKEKLCSDFKMDHFGCNVPWPSVDISSVNDQDQYTLHKERVASYCQRSFCCPDCSLWTDKYQPKISIEVCGNTESVKLLSDWLKSWQERGAQNNKNSSIIEYSDGSSYDDESDIDELDSLKNVLLITGPVGSGKSAAIYACAKEHGFKVIEVNASSLRNGAYMRQTFGEGVDSLGLTHWLAEDETLKTSKLAQVPQPGTPIDNEDGYEAHSNEMSPIACNGENTLEKSSYSHIANKTLFLFEEVDVVFDEDHGFIPAILKLAETTKRPIILTSNNKHPVLPQLLDRLSLDFKSPSCSELLSHVSMVCGFEKVHVSCNLLERVIKACLGDIRRILILLQFWCQGIGGVLAEKQRTLSPMAFDIGAVHLAMPKVMPWSFPCDLSAAVEEEITRAVSAVEETFLPKLMLQHTFNSNEAVGPSEAVTTPAAAQTKKKRRLRKHPHARQAQAQAQAQVPSACIQSAAKHRRCLVFSSESDDELKPLETSSLVKTWRRLRSRRDDLKSMLSDSKEAALVAGLTSGLADLISEADIMFRNCNPLVYVRMNTYMPFPSHVLTSDESLQDKLDEPDYLEMGACATFAQHGVCYYATKYAAVGPRSGNDTAAELAQEILASSTNSTVLGRLLSRQSLTGKSTCVKDVGLDSHQSAVPFGREPEPELYRAILPVVPARLSMALRGAAFHEYLSFAGRMARSECARLAERSVDNPKRRSRTSLHYLCSGAHPLSSEQAELLARTCCFGRAGLPF